MYFIVHFLIQINKQILGFVIILFSVLILASFFTLFQPVFAENWQYPLERILERSSYKTFGQYFDKNSYVGKENLFPNQFVGYHAGIDLEIFPEESNSNVPVFAIGNGTISFVGPVTGYGGLILEKFDNVDLTALYGHLKLSATNLRAGDHVRTGQQLAFLGDAYSNETAGERKHLHFAIYKGHNLYFKGYENTRGALDQKWIDPLQFLQTKTPTPTISSISPTSIQVISDNKNILKILWEQSISRIVTLFYLLGWRQ